MVQNIQTEKTAPLKSTFYSFCKMAGYKISTVEINNELNKYIDALFEDIDISFNTIETINTTTANIILEKITEHDATAFEKVQVNKYFFKKTQVIDLLTFLLHVLKILLLLQIRVVVRKLFRCL